METVRVLLLNSDNEPLHVYKEPWRPLWLVENEKADIVLESKISAHTYNRKIVLPSIIRLRDYKIVKRRSGIPLTRRTIIARDKQTCAYCGRVFEDLSVLTMDHINPKAQKGEHKWENVITACRKCNHKKADRTPEQAGMPLLFKPLRPVGAHAKLLLYAIEPEWEPYLFKGK